MSESDSWSEHDEAATDGPDAPPVAEQMRAATQTLRAHLAAPITATARLRAAAALGGEQAAQAGAMTALLAQTGLRTLG